MEEICMEVTSLGLLVKEICRPIGDGSINV